AARFGLVGPERAVWRLIRRRNRRPRRLPIELIQEAQSLLGRTHRGSGAESSFGVELGQRDGRQLVDELVDADLPAFGQLPKPGMFLVGETNRQGRHYEISFNSSCGPRIRRPGKCSSPERRSRRFLVTIAAAPPATA